MRNMLEDAFSLIPDVEAFLYAPLGAPDAKAMPVRTKKPKMTTARALFIKLIAQYLDFAYRLTLLEIQKLAYFLQASGEPLRLRFEAGLYGPYAANLNKVLERIEGHFIRGYGDTQNPEADIELLGGAVEKADEFLADKDASRERLQKVASVIEGFETPYGMELLSTVHWVAKYQKPPAEVEDIAVRAVHQWNERKRSMFKEKHIRLAWQRLEKEKWL